MSGADTIGPMTVIVAMAIVTYLIRIGGHWIMGRVPPTPFVRASLEALPSAIIMATVVPLALRGGPSAWIGVAVAGLTMVLVRREFVAIVAGLGVVIAARALGLP